MRMLLVLLALANAAMLLVVTGAADPWLGRAARDGAREPQRLAQQVAPQRLTIVATGEAAMAPPAASASGGAQTADQSSAPAPSSAAPSGASSTAAASTAAASTPVASTSSAERGAATASSAAGSAAAAAAASAAAPLPAAVQAPAASVPPATLVALACRTSPLLDADDAAVLRARIRREGLGEVTSTDVAPIGAHWVILGPLPAAEAMAAARERVQAAGLQASEVRRGPELSAKRLPTLVLGRYDTEGDAVAARARAVSAGLAEARAVRAHVAGSVRLRVVSGNAAGVDALPLPEGGRWRACPKG